ncbi:baseplate complex protein [Yersinia pseudotuberculosis]|uniref:Phage protein n=1 Tax=Yersinia pseudotuberculosis serotype O:3 (strain YPIII) TaxID=502800 RepID=A0A0H3B0M7_YERPY|nr:hypothetical protein [Yersinia pseudotuberculosis]AJJ58175.1 putative bacterial nucleoid DNA-binding protein [Yersinia pseudotuberculosis YPIII]AJJ66881.1 putative bacterial nucleoid DNA-binding protein [Yersinia pseudotuberculosis PB1/+]MBK1425901.1 hypothetical protein [Yersinia pseudotuberculosis]MCF1163272.1 hypothetical protein [Yersinia pseudotuberculosis]SQA61808.1 phage-like protein [Yersinia pseudotuberculosis]
MTDIVMLALDGEAIPLKNIIVTLSMSIQDKDQSGQASSTASAEQGTKGKELKVSGIVAYSDKSILTRIFSLAEAKNSDGSKKRYRVAHEMAQAVKFREATFSSGVDAAQQTDSMAWLVNFTLTEHASVAERKAQQASAGGKTTTIQTADGTAGAADGETAETRTWFESVLQKVDNAIGPAGGEA